MALPAIPEPPACTRLNNYGGFTSNMRGVLSYNSTMDKLDNPGMIPVLQDAYSVTTMKMDYLRTMNKTGKECLPGINVAESGFTHMGGRASADNGTVERANKQACDGAYSCGPQLTAACIPLATMATETRESYTKPITNAGKVWQPDILIGQRESGFTRNDAQPNPTDGRVLDPVYLGQYSSFGKFGPSTTRIDFPPHAHAIRSGKEFIVPFCKNTDRRSGFWQERTLPTCVTKGAHKSYCNPAEDYRTTYRMDYPRRFCNNDYTGFVVSGKPIDPLAVLPSVNLFDGKGYYITETMESYSDPPRKRVQLYPNQMVVKDSPPIFPKAPACPPRPDCADYVNVTKCSAPAPVKLPCTGACTIYS